MTDFFLYDQLTWPEINALPRNTPLILLLGEGYSREALANALKNPSRIGLLPPIPFGWSGSGLQVSESLLGTQLSNLLASLRDDGFLQVFTITPQEPDPCLRVEHIALPRGTRIPPSDIPLDCDRSKAVLIPIGHTEQHGYHLPMSTDTLIIDAISQGVASAIPDQAVSLPVMPYGVSTHRSSYTGTMNVGGRAFEDFWMGIIDSLVERGFDRFYFLSGHGGNCSFLVNVVKYAGERHPRIFCATTWLYLSGPLGIESLQKHRLSPIGGMGHACELETSLILHLRPDLVHMDRVVDETDFISTPSYIMDWVEGGPLIANPPWNDETLTGAYGAGSLAIAAHGKIWLEAAIAEKISHVAEIHEQQNRREFRRQSGYGLWGKK